MRQKVLKAIKQSLLTLRNNKDIEDTEEFFLDVFSKKNNDYIVHKYDDHSLFFCVVLRKKKNEEYNEVKIIFFLKNRDEMTQTVFSRYIIDNIVKVVESIITINNSKLLFNKYLVLEGYLK